MMQEISLMLAQSFILHAMENHIQAANLQLKQESKCGRKIASGPAKLREITPTSEAEGEDLKSAHFQVAHWKTAITGIPPGLDPPDYG